jgi:hypothetical protein
MGVSEEYLRYLWYPSGIKREWYLLKTEAIGVRRQRKNGLIISIIN